MGDIRLNLSNVSMKPVLYEMQLHASPEVLAKRVSEHLSENGEQLDNALCYLRDDVLATPSADLLKAPDEDLHALVADLVDELLTGIGKPLPNLPASIAARFDAMLSWHAARLSELDSALFK